MTSKCYFSEQCLQVDQTVVEKMSSVEKLLKQELGTKKLVSTGRGGGGCISHGSAYQTDTGIVFVKFNKESEAMEMFEGEFAGLAALDATGEVTVPKPIKVIKNPEGGGMIVMEYVDMRSLSKHAACLGEQMAKLHQHNTLLGQAQASADRSVHKQQQPGGLEFVSKFGFPVTTCCGYLPQDNTWTDSWVDFFARKIEQQVKFVEKKYNDRTARPVWSTLLPNLPKLFQGLDIQPALMHGDLWGGNAAETEQGPVIFDPASFYGHSEFDLAISKMFGGFGQAFFKSYHAILPKQAGFEDRLDLYQMFHYFNHWSHFGGGYEQSAMSILRRLAKKYS
ncbi:ketosamine-3-kinase [Plakobranchus ocellatus]|uniref:protein-ribulosamine 3-kinase n=1 Tax=Plakobranchus ocellatus TaxID=259542 RepID=A0AAV4AK36_9GAST|nr:ketosamine-3-kinase [Plakobranchus ocellatus]